MGQPWKAAPGSHTFLYLYDGDGRMVKRVVQEGSTVTATTYVGQHYEVQANANWWNTTYPYRRQMTITNGAPSILAAGYTAGLVLTGADASAVYGHSQPSGNDLRVLFWSGANWQELDRDLISFTGSRIEVKLKTQKDIPASGNDGNYYLYYGNPAAGPGPANLHNVYQYYDDFSGTLSNWVQDIGAWTIANGQALAPGGTASAEMHVGSLYAPDGVIEASVNQNGGPWAGIIFRMKDTNNQWQAFLYDQYWLFLRKFVNGQMTDVATPVFIHSLTTPYQIKVTAVGSSIRVAVDGTELINVTDGDNQTASLAGLYAWTTPGLFDNFKARRLASPEPTAAVGTEASYTSVTVSATKYYYANGKRIVFRRDSAVYYVHSDNLGSANKITDSSGAVKNSYLYYPWGSARERSEQVAYDYRYNGQRGIDSAGM